MKKKIALLIIILLFFILCLPNIYNPGINLDEGEAAITCDHMFKDVSMLIHQGLLLSESDVLLPHEGVLPGYYITLFNRIFPIMHGPYTGRIQVYLMFIISRIFGVNVFSLRLTPIVISAITIIFIYLLCKLWFGYRVAVITALLTATNLYFVQYARVGYYREEVFVMCFFWAGFFLIGKYLQERKFPFLYLSLFLLGLGLSVKLTMVFYLVALSAVFILLNNEFHVLSGINIKRACLALFSFFLGSFYLILFNLLEAGRSFKFLFNSLTQVSYSKYDNLAYPHNLWQRANHLIKLYAKRQ